MHESLDKKINIRSPKSCQNLVGDLIHIKMENTLGLPIFGEIIQ